MKTDDEGEVEAVHSATSLRSDVCCGSMDAPLLRTSILLLTLTHPTNIFRVQLTMPAKRKSDEMDATPSGSPTKKMRLTQKQKQALMDNLQLESK